MPQLGAVEDMLSFLMEGFAMGLDQLLCSLPVTSMLMYPP